MKFWIRISPNGCVKGSVLGDFCETALEAHEYFTPVRNDRNEETRRGWRHELVDAEEWDVRAKPCLRGVCAHVMDARRLERRQQLLLLLDRMDRGVLLPEERKLLRALVMEDR